MDTLDGRFRIVRHLAEGGMGAVYEGVQLSVERPVAIKMIREDLVHDATTARRFLREARVLASFRHPRVVQLIDAGHTPSGGLYLAMELLRGRTLDEELTQNGPLPLERACTIAWQLCDVLAAAERRGILHRDLKPANIVLEEPFDLVKVLDFGIAKSLVPDAETSLITHAGVMLGTPQYMSPEAIGGEPDPRSDLYAVGCVLYEMLSGHPPFDAPELHALLRAQLEQPPPPLPADVPPGLCALVAQMLEKDPANRPASARQVCDALVVILDELAEPPTLIRAPPVRTPAPGPHPVRVVLVLLAIAIATFCLALAALTV
jgi:serine/threonine protein kinase